MDVIDRYSDWATAEKGDAATVYFKHNAQRPHCITWTHAEEVNTQLLGFLGEAAKARREIA